MDYDLSKLHPIHQETMKQHMITLRGLRTPDGRLATDVAYEKYLDLNKTVPDIIGKQEDELTKSQLERYEAKKEELATPVQPPTNNDEVVQ